MSSKEKEGLYIPFRCECGYTNESLYVPSEQFILIGLLGKRVICPNCQNRSRAKKDEWMKYPYL